MSTHVFSAQDAGLDHHTRAYNVRKTHRKSRSGCSACKTKRVKCDEQRPRCARCVRHRELCEYGTCTDIPNISSSSGSGNNSPEQLVSPPSGPLNCLVSPAFVTDHDFHLLKHYSILAHAQLVLGPQTTELGTRIWSLAHDYPYLLHSLLATSALHLIHHQAIGYRTAKLTHLQSALREFSLAVTRPPAVPADADAVLLTSLLLNLQYFAWIESPWPAAAWVWQSEAAAPDRLDWLAVQLGLRTLLQDSTGDGRRAGVLDALLGRRRSEVWEIGDSGRGEEGGRRLDYGLGSCEAGSMGGLPADLLRLCGVEEGFSGQGVFVEPLAALAEIVCRPAGECDGLYTFLRFVGALDRRFVDLLRANDHRALLVLAYWFALLCGVELWWCRRRVLRDCWAICMYLDMLGDAQTRALLEFPSVKCGYGQGIAFEDHGTIHQYFPYSSNGFSQFPQLAFETLAIQKL